MLYIKVDLSSENGGEINALVFLNHTKTTFKKTALVKVVTFSSMHGVCDGPIKRNFYGI